MVRSVLRALGVPGWEEFGADVAERVTYVSAEERPRTRTRRRRRRRVRVRADGAWGEG